MRRGGITGPPRVFARVRVPVPVLVLVPGLVFAPVFAGALGQVDEGSFRAEEFQVPGSDERDLQATTPRNWSLTPGPDPQTVRFVGAPEEGDPGPRAGLMAVQVFTDLAVLEAALSRPRADDPDRLQAVFNVGVVPSSIRLNPPWVAEGEQTLATIDVPRLDWDVARWENRSWEEGRSVALWLRAPVPVPDGNGTSPPAGRPAGEAVGSALVLEWRVSFTERFFPAPSPQTPAAVRFTWRLMGEDDATFPADQSLTLRLRYDYDVARRVQRVGPEFPVTMEGAYLVSDADRAALRLQTHHFPLTPAPGSGTFRPSPVQLDVYPTAGGPGPTEEPARFPPPLIVEGVTQPVGHASRGFALAGELAFHTLERDEPGGPEGPGEEPVDPEAPWPVEPVFWSVVFVIALAVVVTVPRLRV